MPRLSVWFIRTGLIYLGLGFTFGGLMLFNKGLPFNPSLWLLLPVHIEFLLVGWIVQLVFGAVFWVLPRFTHAPRRGNVSLAWISFVLLNVGIWLAGVGSLLTLSPWIILPGRLAELGAALAFAAHAWPRVKPTGA